MKVTIDTGDDLECRLRVEVPRAQIDAAVDARLRDLGGTARIKGFRRGKIPHRVLQERYGAEVRSQVVDDVVQQACRDAMAQQQLEPAGALDIAEETSHSEEDFSFVATCEIFPSVTVTGTDSLVVERPVVTIGAADIDELIDRLQHRCCSWQVVSRPSRNGDRVVVDVQGTFDGNVVAGTRRRAVEFVIGDGQVDADTGQLFTGVSTGASIESDVCYPADYHDPSLADRTLRFRMTVRQVAEPRLPEVNDEFFAQFGVASGDIDEFRAVAGADLEREAAVQIESAVKIQLLAALRAANPVALPPLLVSEEAVRLHRQALQRNGSGEGFGVPAEAEFRGRAERNVHMGLLIRSLFREHGMEVLREEINEKIAASCPPNRDPTAWRDQCYGNPDLLAQIENELVDDKVVDWLLRRADVVDKPMSFLTLVAMQESDRVVRRNVLFGTPIT